MRAVEKRTSQLKDGYPARAYNRILSPLEASAKLNLNTKVK